MTQQQMQNQKGFSTLEVLIATVVLILALTAVIVVSFTNQSLVGDAQAGQEALNKVQALLEQEQTLAFSVVGTQTGIDDGTARTDGNFTTRVSVVTPWNGDAQIKQVTAVVSWTGDHNRPESTRLSTLITDYKN